MPEVRCTVNNCVYWDYGNRCGAEAILVISDSAVAQAGQADEEIGEIGHTPATASEETCCYTFRAKDKAR
ncbi:MAG: DUF1540 domain-containing protein [Firmicutes bacterium]|nr:DUF1540 domain-containing protein [Bacillota bacterium]